MRFAQRPETRFSRRRARLCPLSARRRRGASGQRCAKAMPKPVRAALRMRRSGIRGRGAGRFAAAHADGGNAAEPESAARYRRGLVLGPTRPLAAFAARLMHRGDRPLTENGLRFAVETLRLLWQDDAHVRCGLPGFARAGGRLPADSRRQRFFPCRGAAGRTMSKANEWN